MLSDINLNILYLSAMIVKNEKKIISIAREYGFINFFIPKISTGIVVYTRRKVVCKAKHFLYISMFWNAAKLFLNSIKIVNVMHLLFMSTNVFKQQILLKFYFCLFGIRRAVLLVGGAYVIETFLKAFNIMTIRVTGYFQTTKLQIPSGLLVWGSYRKILSRYKRSKVATLLKSRQARLKANIFFTSSLSDLKEKRLWSIHNLRHKHPGFALFKGSIRWLWLFSVNSVLLNNWLFLLKRICYPSPYFHPQSKRLLVIKGLKKIRLKQIQRKQRGRSGRTRTR